MNKKPSIEPVKTTTAKRGRPATGKSMTPAQRQQASRAKRLSEKFETFPAKQINILLSAQASQAYDILPYYSKKSKKGTIEELLIQAYENYKRNL
ncbi:MAG: hypothetical protein WCL29_05005 [Pseudomonadota bacterium]